MPGAIVFELATQEDLDIGVGLVDVTNPGGGTIRGTRFNLGSLAFYKSAQTWTPGALSAVAQVGSLVAIDTTVPGVVKGDVVLATFTGGGMTSATLVYGLILQDGAVRVCIVNLDTISVNPGTGTLRIYVFKTNI